MWPGTEVEFEPREEGALLGRNHPFWDAIGSLREGWRWPRGIPHTVDSYVDLVRGGSYEELTRVQSSSQRRRR